MGTISLDTNRYPATDDLVVVAVDSLAGELYDLSGGLVEMDQMFRPLGQAGKAQLSPVSVLALADPPSEHPCFPSPEPVDVFVAPACWNLST